MNHALPISSDALHIPTFLSRLRAYLFPMFISAALLGFATMLASFYVGKGFTYEALVRIEPEVSTTGEQTSLEAEMDVLRSWSLTAATLEDLQRNVWVRPVASQKRSPLAVIRETIAARLRGLPLVEDVKRVYFPKVMLFAFEGDSAPWINQQFTLEVGADMLTLYDPNGKPVCAAAPRKLCKANVSDRGRSVSLTVQFDTGSARTGDRYILTPVSATEMIRSVRDQIAVTRLGFRDRSGLLMVSFTHGDPVFAEQFLQRYVDHYLRQAYDRSSMGKITALRNLQEASVSIRGDLQQAESEMESFKRLTGTPDLSSRGKDLAQQIERTQRDIDTLLLEISEMEATYLPAHPTMQALLTKKEILSAKLAHLNRQTTALPEQERRVLSLQRAVDTQTKILDANTRNIAQLRADVEMITGYARLLSPPNAKGRALFRRAPIYAAMGVLFGALPWVMMAAFQALPMFARIRSEQELLRYTNLPVIAHFYGDRRMRRRFKWRSRGWVQPSLKDSSAATRHMIDELSRQSRFVVSKNKGGRSIALASVMPSGDISTIACLLAESLAQQSRVLLIDANVMNPQIHHMYGRDGGEGVSDVISQQVTLESTITPTGVANLYVIGGGTPTPNYRLLLEKDRWQAMLAPLSKGFEYIVIAYPTLAAPLQQPTLFAHSDMVVLALHEGIRTQELQALQALGLSQHSGASILYLAGDA